MSDQSFEPGKLVVEFRSGLRIAVRQIDAADNNAINRSLDVTALLVRRISRKLVATDVDLMPAGQDGNAIPRSLAFPRGAVPGLLDGLQRKRQLLRFQLLQADDVRLGSFQPSQQL